MSYLKLQVSFSLNFASLFSALRDRSSMFFYLKTYIIRTNGSHQSANFILSTAHEKFHQIFTLIGSFCWKCIKFQYRGIMSHETEDWCKIWRKTDLRFRKWHEEFGKVLPERSKVSKLGLWWNPFIQSRKYMSLKLPEELCVMIMKNDAKFEEELTCHFKIDMMNLRNFEISTQKSQKFSL